MLRTVSHILFCCLLALSVQAQKAIGTPQTTESSTTVQGQKKQTDKVQRKAERRAKKAEKKVRFKANWALPYPNPYRAGIYSLIFPGAGQIYNKRYWKLPLVWGGFGGLVYAVQYNKREYNRFNDAYGAEIAGEPHEFEQFNVTADALRRQRNSFDKNLQTSYVGFVAMYALTALDAYVDAHLKNFDISDDLSLHITAMDQGRISTGIGIAIRF